MEIQFQSSVPKAGFEPAFSQAVFESAELLLEELPRFDQSEVLTRSFAHSTKEIQAGEMIGFLPALEVLDRHSTESLEKRISDASSRITIPQAREIFLDNLAEFKERGLPPSEYTGTLESILRALQPEDGAVDSGAKKLAALGMMDNAAHPERIAQGRHGTCSVAALEHKLFVQSPARAAAMIEQAVLQ